MTGSQKITPKTFENIVSYVCAYYNMFVFFLPSLKLFITPAWQYLNIDFIVNGRTLKFADFLPHTYVLTMHTHVFSPWEEFLRDRNKE